MVASPHLAVGAAIAHEGLLLPARDVGSMPLIRRRSAFHRGSVMARILGGDHLSLADGLNRPAYANAIHHYSVPNFKVLDGELVLGRNIGLQDQ